MDLINNTYILSLLKNERSSFVRDNLIKFPSLKVFPSVDGSNESEVLSEFSNLNLGFTSLFIGPKHNHNTYGALACWITKIKFLKFQISQELECCIFLEDDVDLKINFFEELYARLSGRLDLLNEKVNIIRLSEWGEGYITSLDSAKRIINLVETDGVINNIDNQLRQNCGQELYIKLKKGFSLLVFPNQGDILKTKPLDKKFYEKLNK
tara:strand:+ start:1327 stop:1953 length:627 start_codon:yes stop_codon:yes gene_type:complete